MSDISGAGGTGARGKLGTPELIIVIAGAVALVSTFLDWIDSDFGGGANAWDDGLFPTYTWVGILGAVMAIQIALTAFANVDMPREILGFTWAQIHLVLAFICALMALSFLIVEKGGGADNGIGFYLALLSSIALLVGAVMLRNETAGRTL